MPAHLGGRERDLVLHVERFNRDRQGDIRRRRDDHIALGRRRLWVDEEADRLFYRGHLQIMALDENLGVGIDLAGEWRARHGDAVEPHAECM